MLAGAEPSPQWPPVSAPPAPVTANGPEAKSNILDAYITTAPSPQVALDLFKGEWSSQLPAPFEHLQAGPVGLFTDVRITWAIERLGGVAGQRVLELGPLEGGHSYILEQAGAAEIVAIEANSRAFLKCLIVRELLGLAHVQFLCGDFVEYLRTTPDRFDAIVASGVLYHMRNPAELIELVAQHSDRVFFWTHYYDKALINASPVLAPKFPASTPTEHAGFKHTLYRQEYQLSLDCSRFCGGGAVHSAWMAREELLDCVRYFGFDQIEIGFEAPTHPNGPCFAFVATRSAH
ncbi:MAG: class I SAM-dependent methyltransferase [Candidatus Viridilinea halotolerans]|uniref:Class I SAM-dependent methyltransferase n=1 Tax=Candidatus Viridilinea halotolerans TaxID=2491704 RepID=A0A426U082_9CHLR|nr:MAG: class I SAM-dependent methyltransferase [Candidatus Viridilinea halotolerans]